MSGRKYLDNSENTKPDRLPQTGEKVDGKNAAHVSIAGNVDDTVIELLRLINLNINLMVKHLEIITGEHLDGYDDN